MSAQTFRALHHGPTSLVLPNVWDPVSARVVAEAGYPAIATSSGAVARVIGFDDGQLTPPAEMFEAVRRIAAAVDRPVTADMEAGYGLPAKEFVERLLEAGAVRKAERPDRRRPDRPRSNPHLVRNQPAHVRHRRTA
jgi:2-methylisocitrate lyase-like PEP mutase family enzyme